LELAVLDAQVVSKGERKGDKAQDPCYTYMLQVLLAAGMLK
jgi:hypothetical protein